MEENRFYFIGKVEVDLLEVAKEDGGVKVVEENTLAVHFQPECQLHFPALIQQTEDGGTLYSGITGTLWSGTPGRHYSGIGSTLWTGLVGYRLNIAKDR
jgi:hypothetical protein